MSSISGGISFSGIGSGTDFESMVAQLKELESFRLYSLEDSRDAATEQYEAMSELIDTVREAMEALEGLNSPGEFLTKVANSSDETVLSAEAGADAIDGTYSVEVKQLASASLWGSNMTFDSKDATINDTDASQTLSYTYKGETRSIEVGPGTTLEGLANIINKDPENPGVTMQLIKVSGGYTFQMAGKESGAEANLTVDGANLVGFRGGNPTWTAADPADLTTALNAGEPAIQQYKYEVFAGGSATPITIDTVKDASGIDVAITGDTTQQQLMDAYIAKGITAEIKDGALVLDDVQSVKRYAKLPSEDATAYTQDSITPVNPVLTNTMSVPDGMDTKLTEGDSYTFTINGGATKTFQVEADESVNDFFGRINTWLTDEGQSSIDASLDTATNTLTYSMKNVASMTTPSGTVNGTYSLTQEDFDADARLQPDTQPATTTFDFTLADGSSVGVDVTRGQSWNDILGNLVTNAAAVGKTVTYDSTTGEVTGITSINTNGLDQYALEGEVTGNDNWTITQAQDAVLKMSGISQEITSSTNEITEVVQGVTFTLKDIGKTQITVASDTESVKANIQLFLDSVNSVIAKMQDLTAVTVDDTESTYSEDATLSNTSAGPLNGEYGINLFQSRLKESMTGSPDGFSTMIKADDIFSGDFIATLSQMGIKTDSDEASSTYGQFVIAPLGSTDAMQAFDQELFDKALSENLEDVISFFAADGEGSTNSPNFRYDSHIDGISEPGTYDVSYTVGADGSITNVMINGVAADGAGNTWYGSSDSGGASGLGITVDNMVAGSYSGTVSIKQGLVGKMEDFFSDELKYFPPSAEDPSIGAENGGLMIMQNSYQELMLSLDEQISNEITRLARWEENERMKFARLDTLLGEYSNTMSMLTSQLGQLG